MKAVLGASTVPSHHGASIVCAQALTTSDPDFAALSRLCNVSDPKNLGIGRDVRDGPWKNAAQSGRQRSLCLAAAWTIENPFLWGKYQAEKRIIAEQLNRLIAHGKQPPPVTPTLFQGIDPSSLQTVSPELHAALNETLLSHGTKPDVLLELLGNGLSDKFCGGIFGKGIYLAESLTKNDQYVEADESYNCRSKLGDLHARLYGKQNQHPGKVYYVLICRTLLGYPVRTQDNQTNMDHWDTGVYAMQNRELAYIDGAYEGSRIHHHSLLAETGVRIQRHREFIQFNKERVYPWYLLAYQRVLDGHQCV